MIDLSLVPIDELYNEIDKRLPTNILISIRPGSGRESVQVKMCGSQTLCLGMMDCVSNEIRRSMVFVSGIVKD